MIARSHWLFLGIGLSVATLGVGCGVAPTAAVVLPTAVSTATPRAISTVLLATPTRVATATAQLATPTRVDATAVANPTGSGLAPQETPIPATWKTFANGDYAVTLRYPSGWERDPRYTLPDQERYVGSGGFFQVSASSADSLDAAADHEANQLQRPYGSRPIVSSLRVDAQEARLILPSADQPGEMAGQAAVIVQSPRPIRLANASYPYLILWADQGHVRTIVSTIRFTVAGALAGPSRFD